MELQLLEWIQMFRTEFLDSFFKIYTTIGNRGEIWFAIILLTALNKKTRYLSIVAICALLIEVVTIEGILKPIFMRPRPFVTHPIDILIPIPHGSSFPSGHSASSFAVASVYLFGKYKHRISIFILASLMAFSRLYLFVHYPSDVLVGSILGLIIGAATYYILEKKLKSRLL